jgi:hypothetical protein
MLPKSVRQHVLDSSAASRGARTTAIRQSWLQDSCCGVLGGAVVGIDASGHVHNAGVRRTWSRSPRCHAPCGTGVSIHPDIRTADMRHPWLQCLCLCI